MRTEIDHRKDDIIPSIVTLVTMGLIVVLLLVCSLKSLIPPPPPKKMVYVELEAPTTGGGGGGGADVPTKTTHAKPSAPNYATQNAVDAPATAHATNTNPNAQAKPTPTVNQNALFKGGKGGSGSGGGEGSGIGTGTGSGLGPGEGSGSGGGIGYGTGSRGLVKQINTEVNEEGQVAVEVHVMADGTVSEARVVNNAKGRTTISNTFIQQQCIREAKKAKYKPGKEELRIILFK